MKYLKHLFIYFLFIGSLRAQSVIPNAGFETWVNNNETPHTYLVPQNWITFDVLETYYEGDTLHSVVRTTQSHSGQYAVLIQPAIDTFGFAVGGNVYSCNSVIAFNGNGPLGFPFSARPASLQGYFKLTSVGGDVGQIAFSLTKWNTASNKRDTLFSTADVTAAAPSSYVQFNIPITYSVNEYPDTASIQFGVIGIPNITHVGTQFYIDDITFSGSVPLGIEQYNTNDNMNIYPNPASGSIQVSLAGNSAIKEITLYNVLGNEVLSSTQTNIDVSTLANGVYFINLKTPQGLLSKKLLVQH